MLKNLLPCLVLLAPAVAQTAPERRAEETARAGNPVFPGWYADPEGVIFGEAYWIFPTYSAPYDKQVFFDAFSSPDLVTWTKHSRILDTSAVKWARRAMWAPAVMEKDGKYYLFFSANDIQNDREVGGIGVAVADRPSGPFRDLLGKPLIDRFHHGAQPIDQFVFKDNDGAYYMIYGGWRHCNIARLKPDFTGFIPFDDGATFKPATPEGYVEGPFMFLKGGKYYFMWSEGGWTGPDYSVAYAIADSPFGPFKRIGKILQQDRAVATGAGHHSVIHVEKTDAWYIVYHRRPLGETDGNHRVTCIDRMQFDEQGRIQPVKITFEGVERHPLAPTFATGAHVEPVKPPRSSATQPEAGDGTSPGWTTRAPMGAALKRDRLLFCNNRWAGETGSMLVKYGPPACTWWTTHEGPVDPTFPVSAPLAGFGNFWGNVSDSSPLPIKLGELEVLRASLSATLPSRGKGRLARDMLSKKGPKILPTDSSHMYRVYWQFYFSDRSTGAKYNRGDFAPTVFGLSCHSTWWGADAGQYKSDGRTWKMCDCKEDSGMGRYIVPLLDPYPEPDADGRIEIRDVDIKSMIDWCIARGFYHPEDYLVFASAGWEVWVLDQNLKMNDMSFVIKQKGRPLLTIPPGSTAASQSRGERQR